MSTGGNKRRRRRKFGPSTVALAVAGVIVAALAVWAVQRDPAAPAYASPPTGVPTAVATETPQPTVLFVGDSYTAGAAGIPSGRTFACQAAALLGWACLVDAQGGTGYVADGHVNSTTFTAYAGRLNADQARYSPDVVVVTGGRNDVREPAAAAAAAADRYARTVRAAFPKARLVLVSPFWTTSVLPPALAAVRDRLRIDASTLRSQFVDPSTWIAGRAGLIGPDGVHPTAAGHAYLARRLAATLRAG